MIWLGWVMLPKFLQSSLNESYRVARLHAAIALERQQRFAVATQFPLGPANGPNLGITVRAHGLVARSTNFPVSVCHVRNTNAHWPISRAALTMFVALTR